MKILKNATTTDIYAEIQFKDAQIVTDLMMYRRIPFAFEPRPGGIARIHVRKEHESALNDCIRKYFPF